MYSGSFLLGFCLELAHTRVASCTHVSSKAHTLLTESTVKKGAALGGRGPEAGPGHSAVQMAFPPAGGAILSKLNARCETGFLLYAPRL